MSYAVQKSESTKVASSVVPAKLDENDLKPEHVELPLSADLRSFTAKSASKSACQEQ